MKKVILEIMLLSTTVFSLSSWGQSDPSVRDIRARLTEKMTFEPTKIAVEDVRYVGIEYITAQDSAIMRSCTSILQSDLDFSPFFENVPLDTFFMRHMELDRMTLLGWKQLAATYVVKLEAEFPRDMLRLRYQLFSTESSREIKKEKFETYKRDYRALVHQIANDIIKSLTGDPGIFDTRIVYSKKVGSASELFVADYDGYNERQVTNNGSINILPSFSPDGQYVYFTSYVGGDPKIYMLNLNTNRYDLISGYPGINSSPAISPDGKSIACVLSKDGNSEIYLLDRKGDIKRRLTNSWTIETSPIWSPDGREIAFTSDRTGSPQIYIMNAEGLDIRRITFEGNYNDSPCWSPWGDRIVYAGRDRNFRICSVDITGKDYRVLVALGENENPKYSPDGNNIVFSSTRLGEKNLYTIDAFGQNLRKITGGGEYSNPAWSPLEK